MIADAERPNKIRCLPQVGLWTLQEIDTQPVRPGVKGADGTLLVAADKAYA